ncbi:hypothetical protein LCGC14_2908800, partial [marine sediment metagenome]
PTKFFKETLLPKLRAKIGMVNSKVMPVLYDAPVETILFLGFGFRQQYPWLETGIGPSDKWGPTVEVRIPLGAEIPFLPNSWSLMELHVVAHSEEQRDAILEQNSHLGPQVVVGEAPHISPLGREASSAPLRPGDGLGLVAMAKHVAGFREANEDYAYHITYYKDLGSIDEEGLNPGGGGAMGRGGYSGHSQGRLFMTEEAGLFFWFGRMEEHASDMSDDPLEDGYVPVVLRFPEPDAEVDEPGTRDAMADSFYSEERVDPENIEIWDGSSWVSLSDWGNVDPAGSFDVDEFDDEVMHVFKDVRENPLFPG